MESKRRTYVLGVGSIVMALVLAACQDSPEATPTSLATTTSVDAPATTTSTPATTTPASTTSSSTGATDGETVTIGRDQEHRVTTDLPVTVHCDGGGELDVIADSADVTVTGECEEIDVEGSGTQVQAEATRDLDVDGDSNTVDAETVGDLDIDGNENIVTVGSVNDIDVEGDNNTVTFMGGNPDIDDEGSGNTITQG